MIKTASILKNEHGAVMILITVMLLVLLTVISIAASRTANIEIKISSNEYFYQRCFYNAEGAIMESIDSLEASGDPTIAPEDWLAVTDSIINDDSIFTYWQSDVYSDAQPQGAAVDTTGSGFMAVHHGILAGDTLDLSKPSKHTFSVYGRCENRGLVLLKMGYTKAY